MKTVIFKISIAFLLLSLLGVDCKKEVSLPICGVNNPLNELAWLKDIKTNFENDSEITSAEIILYQLNGVYYFYVLKTIYSSHDIPNRIYDCDGNEKYVCGGFSPPDNNCSTFFSQAQKIKTLWKK